MATIVPPPPKRQRREAIERTKVQQDVTALLPPDHGSFKARFVDADGQQMADIVEVPMADASEKNISLLLNTLLGREPDDFLPYRFRIHLPEEAIVKDDKNKTSDSTSGPTPRIIDQYPADLYALLRSHGIDNPFETTLTLAAEPQAVFRVQSVTRLAHRIPGHGQPILAVALSPAASRLLATGSGDCTARIWDTETGTPKHTLKKHRGWVLAVAWSPDGSRLATCSMDGTVAVWDPTTGEAVAGAGGKAFEGHTKPVLALAWEPYHCTQDGVEQLASASKDGTVRVWAVATGRVQHVLAGHRGSVSCVRWGGTGLIYSASHDKTVRVWDARRGTLVHELKAHAHWVNHLALSTDFLLRTGYFDHTGVAPETYEEKRAKARERYEKAVATAGAGGEAAGERLVSASDDFTMYLWDPLHSTKPVARLIGHQKAINHVSFSPDGLLVASAGWDNHTKIWRARDGSFVSTLRGHVAPVYQCSWSADARLLVTGSKDATVKVWNVRAAKLAADLPHHEDEVYAVEWSPDGQRVASGGKDKAVRLWRR